MLLVSSITPSGRSWAHQAALASEPGAQVLDGAQLLDDPCVVALAQAVQVAGASVVSPDLVAGVASIRSAGALAALCSRSHADSEPVIAWFPGSVPTAVVDLLSFAHVIDVSGSLMADKGLVEQLREASWAIERGDVELLLVCPPEESAIAAAVSEIAVATACGLRIRGVAVCPMPRKSDGWPKSLRKAARELVDDLRQVIHPIPVGRARRGMAPGFPNEGIDACANAVAEHSDGERVWSITIPGLSMCDAAIGTWTADPAYPTTHVVLEIDGRSVRRRVDSTLRRCEAVDAVVSGDSIAINFQPSADQWPTNGARTGRLFDNRE